MKVSKISIMLVILISIILISSSSLPAEPLDDWQEGDEKKYTGGHTFDEEGIWVADYENTTDDGYNLTSSILYMNSKNVQAFLIAINKVENETTIGTYPYQLFGLHYYSPKGQEVFIGAIFAFLLGYNNSYEPEKGLPNPEHEDVFYIIPFGAGSLVDNNYIPTIERSATKMDSNHFIFEISYKNLYALATPSILASAIWKTGYIAKFTEFTVRYEITLDEENGEVRAETFYTIGQVTALWLVVAGVPLPIDVTEFPDTLGISAVHYVASFTSYSRVVGATSNNTINTGITEEATEELLLEGKDNERVFKIGFRGTYDVLDETQDPPAPVFTDQKAVNVILNAEPLEKILLWKQLLLSADLMSVMAYGISDTVQDDYNSPRDLKQRAIFNFHKQNFWYAVAFPEWDGYRIEHDPVYTAYTVFAAAPSEPDTEEKDEPGICGSTAIILVATTASVCVIGYRKKRKR